MIAAPHELPWLSRPRATLILLCVPPHVFARASSEHRATAPTASGESVSNRVRRESLVFSVFRGVRLSIVLLLRWALAPRISRSPEVEAPQGRAGQLVCGGVCPILQMGRACLVKRPAGAELPHPSFYKFLSFGVRRCWTLLSSGLAGLVRNAAGGVCVCVCVCVCVFVCGADWRFLSSRWHDCHVCHHC